MRAWGQRMGERAAMAGGKEAASSSMQTGMTGAQCGGGSCGRALGFALFAIIAAGLVTLPRPAAAQQQDTGSDPTVVAPDQSQPDTVQTPGFKAFWERFRLALRSHGLAELEAMTQFPFEFNGQTYTRGQFPALARQLYDAKTRRCLLGETPLHDQEVYEVFCGETVYIFGVDPALPPAAGTIPDGSAWRLIELGVND